MCLPINYKPVPVASWHNSPSGPTGKVQHLAVLPFFAQAFLNSRGLDASATRFLQSTSVKITKCLAFIQIRFCEKNHSYLQDLKCHTNLQ